MSLFRGNEWYWRLIRTVIACAAGLGVVLLAGKIAGTAAMDPWLSLAVFAGTAGVLAVAMYLVGLAGTGRKPGTGELPVRDEKGGAHEVL